MYMHVYVYLNIKVYTQTYIYIYIYDIYNRFPNNYDVWYYHTFPTFETWSLDLNLFLYEWFTLCKMNLSVSGKISNLQMKLFYRWIESYFLQMISFFYCNCMFKHNKLQTESRTQKNR